MTEDERLDTMTRAIRLGIKSLLGHGQTPHEAQLLTLAIAELHKPVQTDP